MENKLRELLKLIDENEGSKFFVPFEMTEVCKYVNKEAWIRSERVNKIAYDEYRMLSHTDIKTYNLIRTMLIEFLILDLNNADI